MGDILFKMLVNTHSRHPRTNFMGKIHFKKIVNTCTEPYFMA